MTPEFRRAVLWFSEHAGSIVGQRMLGALHLARAEEIARERDWEFKWEYDEGGADSLGDHDEWCPDARRAAGRTDCCHQRGLDGSRAHEDWCARERARREPSCSHEVLWCALVDAEGAQLASLGGTIDPDRDYRRVIEAELALEALGEERSKDAADRTARGYMAL
jgi:hypothetical protein